MPQLRLEHLEPRETPSTLSYSSIVGELRQSAELPSVQKLSGETPAVRRELNAVPALTLDLSRVTVRVVPFAQWDKPYVMSAYYRPTEIVIREGQEWAVVHELGHAIDDKQGSLVTRAPEAAEHYAWAFHRWVLDGEQNPGFDVMEKV